MSQYKWASNQIKLNRAMAEVEPDASEEQLKAEYVRIGGKLNMDEIKNEVVAEPVEEVVAPIEEVVVPVESPKVESSESVESPEASEVVSEKVEEPVADVA